MDALTFIIPGDPVPLMRPRFSGRRVYDPQSDLKDHWRYLLKEQLPDDFYYTDAPKSLLIIFFMPIPKNTTKYKRKLLKGKHCPHFKKPDLDNLVKFLLDVANGVLYSDDSRITHIDVHKVYDENPRTQFSVIDIDEYVKI